MEFEQFHKHELEELDHDFTLSITGIFLACKSNFGIIINIINLYYNLYKQSNNKRPSVDTQLQISSTLACHFSMQCANTTP